MSDAAALTREEVAELQDGTRVVVLWSGGNGPHEYVVRVGQWGRRYAAMSADEPGRCYAHRPLEFIGTAHPFTRVWLAPTALARSPVAGRTDH